MKLEKIKIGIVGYGNLGRGVECAIQHNPDMELMGVFTRRNPANMVIETKAVGVYPMEQLNSMKGRIDVLILCGGSAKDLPELTPQYAEHFNVVDSFDTHAKIQEHFLAVDLAAKKGGTVAAISIGWDPGMFSLNRAMAETILPGSKSYTFWGQGVSQGHSDAIRRIPGVADARQYTIPIEAAVQRVRVGENPTLSVRDKHTRLCYVVAKEEADQAFIEREIKTMPNYFAEYETTVCFITSDEMKKNHSTLPHGGTVIQCGKTGFSDEHKQLIEYRLRLDSNPEFTASVLTAYARAVFKLSQEGQSGCKTIFDIAPSYLMNMTAEEMRTSLL